MLVARSASGPPIRATHNRAVPPGLTLATNASRFWLSAVSGAPDGHRKTVGSRLTCDVCVSDRVHHQGVAR